jgi:hypothetical protein
MARPALLRRTPLDASGSSSRYGERDDQTDSATNSPHFEHTFPLALDGVKLVLRVMAR